MVSKLGKHDMEVKCKHHSVIITQIVKQTGFNNSAYISFATNVINININI